jgi:hypothetical protein
VNHSLLTADRNTHLKIVGVALLAAIVATGVGMTARMSNHPSLVVTSPTHTVQLAARGTGESAGYVAESDDGHSNRLLR